MKKTRWHKFLAAALSIVMLLSMLPMYAFAEETGSDSADGADVSAAVTDETGDPIGEPAETPTEEPAEDPAEEPAEDPVEDPAEEPAEEPIEEEPMDEPVEEPAQAPEGGDVPALMSLDDGDAGISTQSDNGLPMSIEYQKLESLEALSGKSIAIVSSTTTDADLRILHLTANTTALNQCRAHSVGETLNPTDCEVAAFANTNAHEWAITAVEGGYTIQTKTSGGTYLNIEAGSAKVSADKQVLQIKQTDTRLYTISSEIDGVSYYLDHTGSTWSVSTTPYEVYLYQETTVQAEIASGAPASGTTTGQPFASGTGGSANFRIPSLITLNDGSLLAGIDARWSTTVDAGGLDTIISRSSDDGENWNYSFPNYFNDSTDVYNNQATAFIDPAMAQTEDGTIYLLVDLWPGGVALNNAYNNHPMNSSGYETIDGKYRLVLYASPNPDVQRSSNYTHYVGDFSGGYAPVYARDDSDTPIYYVDEYYYLYDVDKQPIYCQQLGSSKYVQQNVFFWNAELHVTATSYLWLVTSEDDGKTWSAPMMLNEQVRTGLSSNQCFYGVGPGRGLVTSTGRIIFPCYTFVYGVGDGVSSVIYSDDGVNWKRSAGLSSQTSEATVVEVTVNGQNLLYMFARHGVAAVSTDNGATWTENSGLLPTDIYTGCQIDAITYSTRIDGKQAILLSCPTGGSRANGKIYVGLVQTDGSIDWDYSYSVTTGSYAYSCLTELEDGSISLLYEGSSILYENIPIADIAEGAVVGNLRTLKVPLYGTYTDIVDSFEGYDDIDTGIVEINVEDNGDGTYTVTYTGKQEGTVEFTETNSKCEYTIIVEPAALVEQSVEIGSETVSIELEDPAAEITYPADGDIAKVEIKTNVVETKYTGAQGNLGTTSSFGGNLVAMSDALYTFTDDGNDNYIVSAKTSDGNTVYLNIKGGDATIPNQSTSTSIAVNEIGNDLFQLVDQSTSGNGGMLYFHRTNNNTHYLNFNRNSSAAAPHTSFYLYRPAEEGDTSSNEIDGYVRVTGADEITDGGVYLIVAEVGGSYYALYPAAGSSKYAHVVKVNPDAESVDKTYTEKSVYLNITGVGIGTTDAAVGNTVYRITVTGYKAPVFAWANDYSSATATFVHTGDGEDAVKACEITSQTTEATCTADGEIVYTATVEFNGETYTDTKTAAISATGHSYGEPDFVWDGKNGCTAAFACANCDDVQSVTCTVTSETKNATCNQDGATVYTAAATFDGKTYTDTMTVAIGADGHSYGEPTFAWDAGNGCVARFTCEAGDDTKLVVCEVTSKGGATCTAGGSITYTATVTFGGQTYTATKTVSVPAAGHSYGTPVFTWSKDHTSCAAVQTCSVCGDTRTTACTVTSKTTAATATTAGATVYTATATIDGKIYTATTSVSIPATGNGSGNNNTGSNNTDKGTTTPKTGDSTPVVLLVVLISLAFAGCVVIAVIQIRKRRS